MVTITRTVKTHGLSTTCDARDCDARATVRADFPWPGMHSGSVYVCREHVEIAPEVVEYTPPTP